MQNITLLKWDIVNLSNCKFATIFFFTFIQIFSQCLYFLIIWEILFNFLLYFLGVSAMFHDLIDTGHSCLDHLQYFKIMNQSQNTPMIDKSHRSTPMMWNRSITSSTLNDTCQTYIIYIVAAINIWVCLQSKHPNFNERCNFYL